MVRVSIDRGCRKGEKDGWTNGLVKMTPAWSKPDEDRLIKMTPAWYLSDYKDGLTENGTGLVQTRSKEPNEDRLIVNDAGLVQA